METGTYEIGSRHSFRNHALSGQGFFWPLTLFLTSELNGQVSGLLDGPQRWRVVWYG